MFSKVSEGRKNVGRGRWQTERTLLHGCPSLLASLDCWGSSSAPQSPRKDSKLLYLSFFLYFPLHFSYAKDALVIRLGTQLLLMVISKANSLGCKHPTVRFNPFRLVDCLIIFIYQVLTEIKNAQEKKEGPFCYPSHMCPFPNRNIPGKIFPGRR